jgi:hypothetical protein
MGGDDGILCTQHAGERFEIIQENDNGLDEAVRMTYCASSTEWVSSAEGVTERERERSVKKVTLAAPSAHPSLIHPSIRRGALAQEGNDTWAPGNRR